MRGDFSSLTLELCPAVWGDLDPNHLEMPVNPGSGLTPPDWFPLGGSGAQVYE